VGSVATSRVIADTAAPFLNLFLMENGMLGSLHSYITDATVIIYLYTPDEVVMMPDILQKKLITRPES
jgi:hypothetical protein